MHPRTLTLFAALTLAGCGSEGPPAPPPAPAPTAPTSTATAPEPAPATPSPDRTPGEATPAASATATPPQAAASIDPEPPAKAPPPPVSAPPPAADGEGDAPPSDPARAPEEPSAAVPEASPPPDKAPPAARDYKLAPGDSWLAVLVWNDTTALGSAAGHDHAVVATRFTGSATWLPDDPSRCQISLIVPVDKLRADPDGARVRAGLDPDGEVSEKNERTIESNFRSKGQLWADKYPEITFKSTRCAAAGAKVKVEGKLTIRGVTANVSVPMQITTSGDTLRAKGGFEITHSQFGFEPFSTGFGALRNQERLSFQLDLVGKAPAK